MNIYQGKSLKNASRKNITLKTLCTFGINKNKSYFLMLNHITSLNRKIVFDKLRDQKKIKNISYYDDIYTANSIETISNMRSYSLHGHGRGRNIW